MTFRDEEEIDLTDDSLFDIGQDMGEFELLELEDEEPEDLLGESDEPDHDSMFDIDSALSSAGHGTDEDYGYFGGDE